MKAASVVTAKAALAEGWPPAHTSSMLFHVPPAVRMRLRGTSLARVYAQAHASPLIYLADGRDLIVIAANAGHPQHPA